MDNLEALEQAKAITDLFRLGVITKGEGDAMFNKLRESMGLPKIAKLECQKKRPNDPGVVVKGGR